MRPIFALLITIVLLGGTAAYTQFARSVQRPPIKLQKTQAAGRFEIEITRTFDVMADPLAELPALTASLAGQTLYTTDDALPASETIRFEIPRGVELGLNEIYVTANRDFLDTGLGAMSVTLLRDDVPLTRQIIPSEPDIATVSGAVLFDTEVEVADEP